MKREEKTLNSGFSLLEVLLAVVILGLVAAPILQIFLASAQINNNSRELMAATDVASITMEYLNGSKYDGDTGVYKVMTEAASRERIGALNYTSTSSAVTIAGGATNLDQFASSLAASKKFTTGESVYYYTSTDDLGVALHDVSYNGYHFDVVIWFDCMKATGDKYYTYDVDVRVYGTEKISVEDPTTGNSEIKTTHYATNLVNIAGAISNE